MLSTILAATLAASTPQAERLIPVVLVTTDGRALRVKGYEVVGAMVKITALDGSPQIMRASAVDLDRTEAATADAIAAQAAADEAALIAEEQAAEAASARAEARAKAAMQPRRRGGMTVAGGSAKREVEPAAGDGKDVAVKAVGAEPASSGGNWRSRLDGLKDRYRAAKAKIAELTREHDAIVEKHNASRNIAEKDIDRNQIASLRAQLDEAIKVPEPIAAEYKRVQEEARKSGADAAEWRGPIE